jgi:membrane dipeptidase
MKKNPPPNSVKNEKSLIPMGYDEKFHPTNESLWQHALRIQIDSIVIDGHNDIATFMYDSGYDIGLSSTDIYHTDLFRMIKGGISGQFFSIYVDGEFARKGGAACRALNLMDSVYRAVENYPDKLLMAFSVNDIRKAKKVGKIAVLIGLEGGHAIEDSLSTLRLFYRLGVRYMTLTHNNTNNWADSSTGEKIFNGLSTFGKEVVREMNRIGMIVDVSHVSDSTMNDVLDISSSPVIASHSCCWHFSDHPRNIKDDLLKRIKKNGGVVMVNFHSPFLSQRHWDETQRGVNRAYVPFTHIVDHIEYIVKIAGVDHVGLGSDFDGGVSLPLGMKGVEDLPLLTYELLLRGFNEKDIKKILGSNFLKVFSEVEKRANITSRKISGDGSLVQI